MKLSFGFITCPGNGSAFGFSKIPGLELRVILELHHALAAQAQHKQTLTVGKTVGFLIHTQGGYPGIDPVAPITREKVQEPAQVGQKVVHIAHLERAFNLKHHHLAAIFQQQIQFQGLTIELALGALIDMMNFNPSFLEQAQNRRLDQCFQQFTPLAGE